MTLPFAVLRLNKKDVISLDRNQSGGILVSAKIFDDRGDLIAILEKNKFLVTYAAPHFKQTENELIVYDHRDEIALSVHFLNPHAIAVSGSFHYTDGSNEVNSNGERLTFGKGGTASQNCKRRSGNVFYEINGNSLKF